MAGAGAREAEDYYSVLGCDPSSSEEQIMTEYRIRAKESHPDKMGETEEFQVFSEKSLLRDLKMLFLFIYSRYKKRKKLC